MWWASRTAAMSSGLYLSLMSMDRALAVTYPLKAKSVCMAARARKAVAVVWLLPACLNLNLFVSYQYAVDATTGIEMVFLKCPELPWLEVVVSVYQHCLVPLYHLASL